jgi:N-acetylneuraminate synthase
MVEKANHVYIIAEAGVNHNGSLDLAKQLIDSASEAGADAVKFQTFKAEKLVSKHAPKAEYQTKNTNSDESQLSMLKKLELDEDAHRLLIEYSNQKGIEFLTSPFDSESLELLTTKFELDKFKIPSGEVTNAPFLLEIAKTGKAVILSTGMCTLAEIEMALAVLAFGYTNPDGKPSPQAFQAAYASEKGQRALQGKVDLLHCTTQYPTPYEEVNLLAMDTISNAFGIQCGYSDHTLGLAVPIAAVARGAQMIEKHFTLDRNLPGPDHKASLEPNELKELVESIRQIEKALGNPVKKPTASEVKNKPIVRKSVVASRKISKGEHFSLDNLAIKRPGNGIEPIYYWDLLGRKAGKDFEEDEAVK